MPILPRLILRLLDGLQYSILLTVLLVGVLAPISFVATGNLILLKQLFFIFGFLFIAIGSWKLRPSSKGGEEGRLDISNSHATNGFGGFVNRLPPTTWYLDEGLPLSDGSRIAFAGVFLLVVSYLLEVIFHIGVPPQLR